MNEVYILAFIGYIALVYVIMKLGFLFIDKFIWKYMEKDEKRMIHESLEYSHMSKEE